MLQVPSEMAVVPPRTFFKANVSRVLNDSLVQPAHCVHSDARASRQVSEHGVAPHYLYDALGEAFNAHLMWCAALALVPRAADARKQ